MPATDECFCVLSKSNDTCAGERVLSLGLLLPGDFGATLREDRDEAARRDSTESSQCLVDHTPLLVVAVKTAEVEASQNASRHSLSLAHAIALLPL